MRKLAVNAFITMDGVMQSPGAPDEDPENGFKHGGWLVPYFDEKFLQVATDWTMQAGALLLGRKTYDIFAGSWPNSTDPDDKVAVALNTLPKYVASQTLTTVGWNNSTLLQGDVARAVAKLKETDGAEIQVHGSSNLIQTLLNHDLVDTLRIWQFPVVVGSGKRLFGDGTVPVGFKLEELQQNTQGAVMLVYQRAGSLKYGVVEVGQETVLFD